MSPIGKLPVTVSLNTAQYHIYPQVNGALLSWKAARGLKILSESYPHPPPTSVPPGTPMAEQAARTLDVPPSIAVVESDNLMVDSPTVFDGQVKTMDRW